MNIFEGAQFGDIFITHGNNEGIFLGRNSEETDKELYDIAFKAVPNRDYDHVIKTYRPNGRYVRYSQYLKEPCTSDILKKK